MVQTIEDPKVSYSTVDQKFKAIYGKSSHDLVQTMAFVDKHDQHHEQLDALLTADKALLHSVLKSVDRTGGYGVPRPMIVNANVGLAQAQVAVATPEYITAEAFLWGFHVEIPEAPLKTLMNASNIIKAISAVGTAGAGGVALIAGASTPPGVVIIAGIAAAFAVESVAINIADHGKGVYLSWTWFQVPLLASMAGAAAALPLPTAR